MFLNYITILGRVLMVLFTGHAPHVRLKVECRDSLTAMIVSESFPRDSRFEALLLCTFIMSFLLNPARA